MKVLATGLSFVILLNYLAVFIVNDVRIQESEMCWFVRDLALVLKELACGHEIGPV